MQKSVIGTIYVIRIFMFKCVVLTNLNVNLASYVYVELMIKLVPMMYYTSGMFI